MRQVLTILIALLVLVSCEEELSGDISPVDNDLLVVDAILTNEKINHLVKLTRTNPESNGGYNPATGATVLISDGTNVNLLLEFPPQSGLYFTNGNFRALFGKQYVLFIQYNGKDYSATDSSVPGEPFSNESVYREAKDSLFTLNFVEGKSASMTRHIIRWDQTSYCIQNNEDPCIAKVVHYDLKSVDINENFHPPKEEVLFPGQSIIIRKRYSLSDNYQQFLRSMLSETEWRGGYFDVQRGNVITNLSEGAVGFFAVTTVVTDTTIVE